MTDDLHKACEVLRSGGVIAYATEAVFGLGCDPDNEAAVQKLLEIKQRPIEKGLILIAASWEQVLPYLDVSNLSNEQLHRAFISWPGPYSWVFPAKRSTPKWLTGQFDSLAVRSSAQPQVQALCRIYGKPMVSTSANLTSLLPCRTTEEVRLQLASRIDYILPGIVGTQTNPSEIRDVITNQLFRAG